MKEKNLPSDVAMCKKVLIKLLQPRFSLKVIECDCHFFLLLHKTHSITTININHQKNSIFLH